MDFNTQVTTDQSPMEDPASITTADLPLEGTEEVITTDGISSEADNEELRKTELQDEGFLTREIGQLWAIRCSHGTVINNEKGRIQRVDNQLGELLFHLKLVLAKPGRNGKWTAWLKENKVARASADRIVQRFEAALPGFESPHDADSEPTEADIVKLFKAVWSRLQKVLTTSESIIQFIRCILTASGVAHEWREGGLMIFIPVPKVVDELPGSDLTPDLASASCDDADPNVKDAAAEIVIATTAIEQVVGNGDSDAGAMA